MVPRQRIVKSDLHDDGGFSQRSGLLALRNLTAGTTLPARFHENVGCARGSRFSTALRSPASRTLRHSGPEFIRMECGVSECWASFERPPPYPDMM